MCDISIEFALGLALAFGVIIALLILGGGLIGSYMCNRQANILVRRVDDLESENAKLRAEIDELQRLYRISLENTDRVYAEASSQNEKIAHQQAEIEKLRRLVSDRG